MDLVRTELEGRHVGVAGVDALSQRLPKALDGIALVQGPQRRCDLERTVRRTVDRVAARAMGSRKALPPCSAVGAARTGVIRSNPINP